MIRKKEEDGQDATGRIEGERIDEGRRRCVVVLFSFVVFDM